MLHVVNGFKALPCYLLILTPKNDIVEFVFDVYIIVFAVVFITIVAFCTLVACFSLKIIKTLTLAFLAFSVIVAIISF